MTPSTEVGPRIGKELHQNHDEKETVYYSMATAIVPVTCCARIALIQYAQWVDENELQDCAPIHTFQRKCVIIALQSCKVAQDWNSRVSAKGKPKQKTSQTAPQLGNMDAYSGEGPYEVILHDAPN